MWELANTAEASAEARLRFKAFAHKQALSCGLSSHTLRTLSVKHAHRLTQILLISLQKEKKKEWPRLGCNKGRGFASRMGWGVHPCRPLHCLFALETQTL